MQTGTQKLLEDGCEKKTSATLAGLLALPCGIGEFNCVPPHNEEKYKTQLVHTNYQQLVQNLCKLFLANGHIIYIPMIFRKCFDSGSIPENSDPSKPLIHRGFRHSWDWRSPWPMLHTTPATRPSAPVCLGVCCKFHWGKLGSQMRLSRLIQWKTSMFEMLWMVLIYD